MLSIVGKKKCKSALKWIWPYDWNCFTIKHEKWGQLICWYNVLAIETTLLINVRPTYKKFTIMSVLQCVSINIVIFAVI